MPVSKNRSRMSLSRHGDLLMKYSEAPERNTRRETVTSLNSVGRMPRSFLKVRWTSAMPSGLRAGEPLKITSSMVSPRSWRALCSPITQRMASETLVLPQPFGPMMPVMPPLKSTSVLSTNDLKPWRSRRWRNIGAPSLRVAIREGLSDFGDLVVAQGAHVHPELPCSDVADHRRFRGAYPPVDLFDRASLPLGRHHPTLEARQRQRPATDLSR